MSRYNREEGSHNHRDRQWHNNDHHRDYSNNQRRDRSRDDRKQKKNDRQTNHHHHSYDKYGKDKSKWQKYDDHQKVKTCLEVELCEVAPPAQEIIVDQSYSFKGPFKINFLHNKAIPSRVQQSRLGQLKNKITPVERIWTSHIKQYLNISEFVEIHRRGKSLAYPPIQYGKSIVNYSEGEAIMTYDNSVEQSQIFSRAYFKLWEILQLGVLSQFKCKPLTIGCVAEGPGGFIHSLIDYRQKQHQGVDCPPKDYFYAITLRMDESTRNAKDWSDNRGKKLFGTLRGFGYKIRLSYGRTGTGDLLKPQNIEAFQEEIGKKCELVTGDGGIECIGDKEFQYQEIFNVKLFFGEIISALHIQAFDGTFILKIYDCGFEITRQLILLLSLYYKTVKIVKPITSRPGNSQRYLLCQNFIGASQQDLNALKKLLVQWVDVEPKTSYFQNENFAYNVFDFSHLPDHQRVYDNIKKSNDIFVREQEQKLQEGLQLAERFKTAQAVQQELRKNRYQEQINFAYSWCKKYRIAPIPSKLKTQNQ